MRRAPIALVAATVAVAAMVATAFFYDGDRPRRARPRGARGHRPVNVQTSLDRVLALSDKAEQEQTPHPRVVALAPGAAQIARDLRLGHLLVGRHASDKWSDQRLIVCGDQGGIDYEKLIAVEPSHIFLQWNQEAVPARLKELADQRGWKLINLKLVTLEDVHNAIHTLRDTVTPQELRALAWESAHTYADPQSEQPGLPGDGRAESIQNALPLLVARFNAAMTRDEGLEKAGRILVLYQEEGEQGAASLSALGPGSYHHDILVNVGGRPAIEKGSIFMSLDAEDISRLRPDGILLVRPRSAAGATARDAQGLGSAFTTLSNLDIPAVTNRRVGLVDDPMGLIPGTNLVSVADQMRSILNRWAAATPGSGPARAEPR